MLLGDTPRCETVFDRVAGDWRPWHVRERSYQAFLLPPDFAQVVNESQWTSGANSISVREVGPTDHLADEHGGAERCFIGSNAVRAVISTRLENSRATMSAWLVEYENGEWLQRLDSFAFEGDAAHVPVFNSIVASAIGAYPLAPETERPDGPDVHARDGLRLVLAETQATLLRFGECAPLGRRVVMIVENRSREIARLARPGDGSVSGRRTPVISVEVRRGRRIVCGPRREPQEKRHRDDVSALRPSELVDLLPGEGCVLSPYLPDGFVPGRGNYEVTAVYQNSPSLAWMRPMLGASHDQETMELVRASTKCRLVSEPLGLRVSYVQRMSLGPPRQRWGR